jgi:hypothetical protein
MVSLRKAGMLALVPILAGGALLGTAAAAQTAGTDYFTYRNGGRIVVMPEDADMAQMSASPMNLIDESSKTDWEGQGSQAVFVLELAEETELSRIAFDTAFLNKDRKAPRAFTVELSNTSANAGFEEVLSGQLRMKADNQSFSFKDGERPVGRWVRLTIQSNYGEEYTAFTGFHGFGRQMTNSVSMPNVTGSYEGSSGLGAGHLRQDGNRVTGCYSYQQGEISGVIKGRVLILDITETDSSGSSTPRTGIFQFSSRDRGVLVGLVRNNTVASRESYADYYRFEKTGNSASGC